MLSVNEPVVFLWWSQGPVYVCIVFLSCPYRARLSHPCYLGIVLAPLTIHNLAEQRFLSP